MQRQVLLTRGGLAGGFPFGFAASPCLLSAVEGLCAGAWGAELTGDLYLDQPRLL